MTTEQTKMSTAQMLKDLGKYEFKAIDGTVLHLRQLAENEREDFFGETYQWCLSQLSKAHEEQDPKLFMKAHRQFVGVVRFLGVSPDQAKKVYNWNKRRYMADMFMLLTRIAEVEEAIAKGETPPEQGGLMSEEQVASANPTELEKQGESSPGDDPTPTT